METVTIGRKPFKVAKDVKEHIEWLRIQLEVKARLSTKIEGIIEQFEEMQRDKFSKLQDCLTEIKKHHS